MIKLIIKEKGQMLSIPGLTTVRTPAEVDITGLDIRVVYMTLLKNNIKGFVIREEAESSKEAKKDIKVKLESTKDDITISEKIDSKLTKRMSNLEKMMLKLISQTKDRKTIDSEQIIDRIGKLQEVTEQLLEKNYPKEKIKKIIEKDLDAFIPEIDFEDMEISGEVVDRVEKGRDDLEDTASFLSGLIKEDE
jgi:hypothetical protein